jgi:hypothetical protein
MHTTVLSYKRNSNGRAQEAQEETGISQQIYYNYRVRFV